jgi:glycosyltransferase involved in cell wall biosynthesis
VTFHYSARIDDAVTGARTPASIQDARAERRIAGSASTIFAFSERVATFLGHGAHFVPIAYEPPEAPFPETREPVAVCVADWTWPPNRRALAVLRKAWPRTRGEVPSARLRLAGRGLEGSEGGHGVEILGPVASSAEVLAGAAVVAFPCPASSGPKVKVLEALAGGRAVVTTEAGLEGLCEGARAGAIVAESDPVAFGTALAAFLRDPLQLAEATVGAREAIAIEHGPRAAARRRLEVLG